MGMRPSMGTVGDAYDNAMAESFFAALECELIDRRSWQTKTEARLAKQVRRHHHLRSSRHPSAQQDQVQLQ